MLAWYEEVPRMTREDAERWAQGLEEVMDQIGGRFGRVDPLPPGQVFAIGPGGHDEATSLYRIEVTEGPGSEVRILNQAPPAPFRESIRLAEQNL
jgi:hypothetical protein